MKCNYQICTNCVMDTTDPDIFFDENGVCNHCINFQEVTKQNWFPDEKGTEIWQDWVTKIKADGKGKDYDCIIGISGGIDSAYLAYKLQEYNLRILAVHIDAGWNSDISVRNIELLIKNLNLDLFTHVVNWEEMKDLQRSYLKASVINQDIPQDHAFFARLCQEAKIHKIKYFLSGGNISTECVLPSSWGFDNLDLKNLKAIHKYYGQNKLKDYPTIGFWDVYVINPFLRNQKILRPLNFMKYKKEEAKKELTEKIGWNDYGDKHHESRFTRFYQGYYLYEKFGIDKRKAHLSSLILTNQLSRDKALDELEKKPYDIALIEEDISYIAKKLELSVDEFMVILESPANKHEDFSTNVRLRNLVKFGKKLLPGISIK